MSTIVVTAIPETTIEGISIKTVAGGEGYFARGGDTGDLNVADLDGPANLPLFSSDCGCGFSISSVEPNSKGPPSSLVKLRAAASPISSWHVTIGQIIFQWPNLDVFGYAHCPDVALCRPLASTVNSRAAARLAVGGDDAPLDQFVHNPAAAR